MQKDKFNEKLRSYVDSEISITQEDRRFVSSVYNALQDVLGDDNCFRVGSYKRGTVIRPPHDLDVLYVVGGWQSRIWDMKSYDPREVLRELRKKLGEYKNPVSQYEVDISKQTHSITIAFKDKQGNENFAIDVVPAYRMDKNEYSEDMYVVPEILIRSRKDRNTYYKDIQSIGGNVGWIKTDPRGYISIAKDISETNSDFLRAVKFTKKWKDNHKKQDDDFKLKSFHIEQVITRYFQSSSEMTIYDAIFQFFTDLEDIISRPKIQDRADSSKYIDDYLEKLSRTQKDKIITAGGYILDIIKDFEDGDRIEDLLEPKKNNHHRKIKPMSPYAY